MHTCDNPPCCNPSHLKAVTHGENMRDMILKKRRQMPKGESHHAARITNTTAETIRELAKIITNKREISRTLKIPYHVVFNVLKRGAYT